MSGLLFSSPSTARQGAQANSIYKIGYTPCWDQAGAYHNIDPWLLYAIASVESNFNPVAHNKANRNGTFDFGMMQINSVHFPELRKYGIPFEILADRCGSTYVGAWILSRAFKQCGRNWKAVAAYNTGSCNRGLAYAAKVQKAYLKYAPKGSLAHTNVQETIKSHPVTKTNTEISTLAIR